jgi:hypothetical protein
MKKILLSVFLCLLFSASSAQAYEIYGDKSLMRITNKGNESQVYVKLANGQEKLVYKTTPIFPYYYEFDAFQADGLIGIGFNCNEAMYAINCSLIVDSHTGEHAFYNNLYAVSKENDIGFLYDKNKSLVILKPILKPCKKPLIYSLKIYPASDLGKKTDFLPDGNLQIDYFRASNGDSMLKVIPINYPKLLADCQGQD